MSGKHQATFFLMLLMMAVVANANSIGRYPEKSENADYVFALGRQSLANCPKCEDCPAQPVCPTCPTFLSNSALTTCLTLPSVAKSSAREGSINVQSVANGVMCNFAIATLPPYTKIRIKCPTQTLGGVNPVQATYFGQPITAPEPVLPNVDLLATSPGVYLSVTSAQANGAVKCTWNSE